MKNKLSTTFSQGFQSGTFIRVGENRDLSLFVGKDEKGNYAFDFRGTYVPVRISQSDVITVQQGKSGENYILRFSLCNSELLEYFSTFLGVSFLSFSDTNFQVFYSIFHIQSFVNSVS